MKARIGGIGEVLLELEHRVRLELTTFGLQNRRSAIRTTDALNWQTTDDLNADHKDLESRILPLEQWPIIGAGGES